MRLQKLALLVTSCGLILGCLSSGSTTPPTDVDPPVAKIAAKQLEIHGDIRTDDYYWLNERKNPDVIAYLEVENEYTAAMTAHTAELEQTLFREFKERIKQTDTSVPYKYNDYFYYTRREADLDYPIYCRKRGSLEADEEVMLDLNLLAEGHDFLAVRGRSVSSGQDILAYSVDTVGRRIYTLHFKNLTTGEAYKDEIPKVTGNVAWANDNKTLFYTRQHPETLRSYQIFRHELGTDPAQDELVYEEKDDTFNSFVYKTKSEEYVVIGSSHTLSAEYRYLDADKPRGKFKVFLPRERDHEYQVEHYGDHFYVRTNDDAKNFRLMRTPVGKTGRRHWEEVIPHRDDVFLNDFEIFKDYLVIAERREGLIQMRIRPWSGDDEHYLDFGEPAYLAYATANYEFDTPVLRYGYTSMTTPNSVFDYNMKSREKTLLKQDEVLGGFDSVNYETERFSATTRDGTEVPISIVYRKEFKRDGSHPLLLYGYGSYGASMDARFSPYLISLLDRGFVYAIAHVRGGQELGRDWYENGKLFNKKNTFTDFIDCAEHLIEQKYANPERVFAMGGSAGGLLMGAIINMRPDLLHGVVTRVPFVDIITTMLDPSIPLTTSEYDEWGNPNEKDDYDYILSYSPYDNVEAKDYPNLLVTTGLHDSQVQYFEPAKWVAKLRATKTDDNRLLLKTDMEAGHGGASARDKRYHDTAFIYAFLLDLAGS